MAKTTEHQQQMRLWCESAVLLVSLALLTFRILSTSSPIDHKDNESNQVHLWAELTSIWFVAATASFLHYKISALLQPSPSSSVYPSSNMFMNEVPIQFREQADSGIIVGVFIVPFSLLSKAFLLQSYSYSNEAEMVVELLWGSVMCINSLLLSLFISSITTKTTFSVTNYILSVMLTSAIFVILEMAVSSFKIGSLLPLIALSLIFYIIFCILIRFNKVFTFGEAVAMAQLISLFSIDAVRNSLFHLSQQSSETIDSSWRSAREEADIVIHVLLLSILVIGIALSPLIKHLRNNNMITILEHDRYQKTKSRGHLVVAFYVVLAVSVVFGVFPILSTLLNQHPLFWITSFLLTQGRIFLVLYWVLLLSVSLYAVARPSNFLSNTPNIVIRKYFHALAILLFVPGVMFEQQFLRLCFAVAISLFLLVEYIRLGSVPPLGKVVDGFMRSFTDKRDSGDIVLTHTYLLLGCAMPLWMNGAICFHLLAPYAGILVLGVGDSMASIVGKRYGKHRWPGTRKTFEGTSAAVISTFLAGVMIFFVLHPLSSTTKLWLSSKSETLHTLQFVGFAIATALACLLESFTTQIDNLFLPLFYEALITICLN